MRLDCHGLLTIFRISVYYFLNIVLQHHVSIFPPRRSLGRKEIGHGPLVKLELPHGLVFAHQAVWSGICQKSYCCKPSFGQERSIIMGDKLRQF